MPGIEKLCEGCGAPFTTTTSYKQQRYCSRGCWLAKYNSEDPDGHGRRGAERAGEHHRTVTRGSGSEKSYVKEDGAHQHRVLAERLLGRKLRPGEVVHHEDGNKKHNVSENLVVFPSQAEHARHHAHLRWHPEEVCTCRCTRFKRQEPSS